MKKTYFLSDAHLGSRAVKHRRTNERRLVNFLDSIKHEAEAIYLLGDIFDYWFEYKNVVPKGYTRLLGKISELTDMGVEVHFFTGTSSPSQQRYTARNSSWHTATDWATRAADSRCSGQCFTTRPCRHYSQPYIPAGQWSWA